MKVLAKGSVLFCGDGARNENPRHQKSHDDLHNLRTKFALSCLVILSAIFLSSPSAQATSIYVDYYNASGTYFGKGAPSSSFGAAAGTPGVWNHLGSTESSVSVVDIFGGPTGVTVSNLEGTTNGNNGGAPAGDISLLLNDVLDGSPVTITVDGLPTGLYNVYTYSWYPANSTAVVSTVTVNGLDPQNVGRTGAYAGFVLGETHALHTVSLASPQTLTINAAAASIIGIVNGFQIVMVPEPAALVLASVAGACWLVVMRSRRKR
jgi:hypothetical protein